MNNSDNFWMERALQLAEEAAAKGEVPVGAVLVREGQLIGQGFNQPISSCDPTAHAEVVALRDAAAKVGNYRLSGATLYVTLEPCTMCAGALVHARVDRVVFGASEPKAGAVISRHKFFDNDWLNHRVSYSQSQLSERCSGDLSRFFQQRRAQKKIEKQSDVD